MSKRSRFIISAITLSVGFVWTQFIDDSFKFLSIGLLAFVTGLLSYWSFSEGLGKDMTLLSLVLPILFTLGVGVFWFLLPSSIYTQIPIVIFYGFGIYILSLTMNIYTVSSQRTIALLRAARGVGFVLTLLTAFLIYDAVLSIRLNLIVSSVFIYITSFFLFLQGFWSIELEKRADYNLLSMSLISAFSVTQLAMLIFFWPVTVVVGSIF